MRTQIGLYLDVGVCDELRSRARAADVPIADLAEVLLRHGLERLTLDGLKAWAETRRSKRGRHGGGLRLAERQIVEALARLKTGDGFRFDLKSVASEAGLLLTPAFLALKQLRARGIVEGMEWGTDLDAWGRPLASKWWLVSEKSKFDAALRRESA